MNVQLTPVQAKSANLRPQNPKFECVTLSIHLEKLADSIVQVQKTRFSVVLLTLYKLMLLKWLSKFQNHKTNRFDQIQNSWSIPAPANPLSTFASLVVWSVLGRHWNPTRLASLHVPTSAAATRFYTDAVINCLVQNTQPMRKKRYIPFLQWCQIKHSTLFTSGSIHLRFQISD